MQIASTPLFMFAHDALLGLRHKLHAMFLEPASLLSIQSLACALLIATIATLGARRNARPIRLRVLIRALFPRRLHASASGRADIMLFLFNAFVAVMLFGWAIISTATVYGRAGHLLETTFGRLPPTLLPHWLTMAVATVTLYLAFEFAYWLDHFLSHRVALLWRFHKVHHSAESLSPLTNFRIHPINSLIFVNIVALVTGWTGALLTFAFGGEPGLATIGGANLLLVASGWLLTHLLHTHLWIAFDGPLGRIFQSPAHHQLHHSSDPAHRDCNFGASSSLFDWLFGTLILPTRRRPPLVFGVTGERSRHDLASLLVAPVTDLARDGVHAAAATLRPEPYQSNQPRSG
jgi:sterol desaturase/sphingolipid hydroxylase (fatty acid hydroxylase superfamily)